MNDDTRQSAQRRALLKALAASAAAAPALGPAAQEAAKSGASLPKVLRYAFLIAETGMDPVQIVDLYSRILTAHIFEGLYDYDHLARPYLIRPATAVALPEISEDFRTWTVRIKPGIFFHDDPVFKGKPRELVAQDYVYAFKRFFDPRWKSPAYATLHELQMLGMAPLRDAVLKDKKAFAYDTDVEGLRALDHYTIRFRFERPQPRFIQTLATGDLYGAVAREVVEAYGDDIMAHPVGTGPFRLVDWRRSSKIIFERNANFRDVRYDFQPNADDAEGQALLAKFKGRRLPLVDRVEVSIIDEAQPRWLSFLQKAQDLLWLLPNDFVNIALPNNKVAPNLARQGLRAFRMLASDNTQTVFNMDSPIVGGYTPEKIALRRALELASNTGQEIRLERKGQAVPAQSPLMPNTMGYDPKYMKEAYDPARARALLDTYGYVDRDGDGWRDNPDGSPLTVVVSTQPDQASRRLDELQRKDYTAIGIRTEFQQAKWPENLKNVRAGNFMVWRVGQSAAAPDGQPAFDKGASIHFGGQNLARFRNKAFDEMYARIQVLPDGPEREQLFYQGKRIFAAYVPYGWGVHRILTDLAWPWLEGFRRPPYWLNWWHCVDIDAQKQSDATR
jgi:ABC-type transport system substrate-binding protein